MHLVLYQPEIPHNVGTLMRFTACMGVELDIIEPCGFLFTDKHLKRAGMDYIELSSTTRFSSWDHFKEVRKSSRHIAIIPDAPTSYTDFAFRPTDALIMGQESSGLPHPLIEKCHEAVNIPMLAARRSLNLAISAAIVTSEALRQTNQLPRRNS